MRECYLLNKSQLLCLVLSVDSVPVSVPVMSSMHRHTHSAAMASSFTCSASLLPSLFLCDIPGSWCLLRLQAGRPCVYTQA